jgi:predicted GNAT superfamily acetyltransferase
MIRRMIEFRDVGSEDLQAVVDLNQAAMPALSDTTLDEMRWFSGVASYFKVVVDDGRIIGFLIALAPGVPYRSENYRWFSSRYDDFLYVDRIAIAADARGRGIGGSFYEDLARFASGRTARITCEVNTRPRNEGSLRFHTRHGFTEVGSQDTEGGKKTVALLEKRL